MSQQVQHLVDRIDDPRVTRDDYRYVTGDERTGSVTLVGVVHDHPASVFRTTETITGLRPDAVAIEVAPMAVPLFRRYAREQREPSERIAAEPTEGDDVSSQGVEAPNDTVPPDPDEALVVPEGGEMTAAIEAADDATVAGIDFPNPRQLIPVVDAVRDESLSQRDRYRVCSAFGRQFAHALRCRVSHLAETVGVRLDPRIEDDRASYTRSTSPTKQATEESEVVGPGTTLLRALTPPPSIRVFDRAREAGMISTLRELRREGSVVAVVGYAHLDPIANELAAGPTAE